MPERNPPALNGYPHSIKISTRWMDNDVYGHVNNVIYYSWFDTVVNDYLLSQGVLDFRDGEIVGLVVATQCNYFAAVAFPDVITAGLRVAHIGNSSVRYEIGLFKNAETTASAAGHFVHVYVDRKTRQPVSVPDKLRSVLVPLYQ